MATPDQIAQLRVHRQIAEIAGGRRARKPTAKIPELREPRGLRTAYLVALRREIAELQGLTTEIIIAGLPRLVQLLPVELRLDAAADDRLALDMDLLRGASGEVFGEVATTAARTTAQGVSAFHRTETGRQMKAAIGIDPFIGDANLSGQIDGFVADNVALIKNLKAEQLARIEGIVARGLRSGARVETMSKELRESFGITRRRAELIATDQVNKLNAQLTRSRQQQVGITEYRWSTSRDERVRPGHRALDGTVQKWSKPPITNPKSGGRAHPGEDIRCRCQAIPVVDTLLEDLGITL